MLRNFNPVSNRWICLVCGTEKGHYQFVNASVRDFPCLPSPRACESLYLFENYPRWGAHVSYTVKPHAASDCSVHTAAADFGLFVGSMCHVLLIDSLFLSRQKSIRTPALFHTRERGALVRRTAWTGKSGLCQLKAFVALQLCAVLVASQSQLHNLRTCLRHWCLGPTASDSDSVASRAAAFSVVIATPLVTPLGGSKSLCMLCTSVILSFPTFFSFSSSLLFQSSSHLTALSLILFFFSLHIGPASKALQWGDKGLLGRQVVSPKSLPVRSPFWALHFIASSQQPCKAGRSGPPTTGKLTRGATSPPLGYTPRSLESSSHQSHFAVLPLLLTMGDKIRAQEESGDHQKDWIGA